MMLTNDDIKNRVIAIVQEQTRAHPRGDSFAEADIGMASTFGDALGMDSLDVVEILMHAEEQFGVSLQDESITVLSTPADVIGLVTATLRETAGAAA